MLRILLIQPGSTDLDEQGRIKGSLDLPLSVNGAGQASRVAEQLSDEPIEAIYASPSQSAVQTATAIARNRRVRLRRLGKLRNVDHGLWHGKLIEEVKQRLPRAYRRGQDNPEEFCPPEGEPLAAARQRAQSVLNRLIKKHKSGTVALVVPEPMATVIRRLLDADPMESVWKSEKDCGGWTLIELPTSEVPIAT